jgi:uncharacterized membrane protein
VHIPPSGFSPYPRENQGIGHIPLQGPGVHFNLFSKAWKVIKSNATVFVLGTIVFFLLDTLFTMPAQFLQSYLAYGSITALNPKNFDLEGFIIGSVVLGIVMFTTSCIYYKISSAAVVLAETGNIQIESIFKGFKNLNQLFQFSLVYGFAVTFGLLLFIIPGIIIASVLAFAPLAIMHENLNATEAIQVTWERTKPYLIEVVIFQILGSLICFSGALLCLVGLLATIPIYYVAVGLQYRELRGPVMVAGSQRDFNSQVPPTL